MGLMDILNGMQHGPGGGGSASAPSGSGGGMSPIMTALLALLAYKAVQGSGGLGGIFGGRQQQNAPAPEPPSSSGGGLGDILGGIFGGNRGTGAAPSGGGLGGILGGLFGGNAGGALNGGLGQIINDLQRAGHGQAAQSWVGDGQNQPIPPNELGRALGDDTVSKLEQQSGLSRDELLQGLSRHLPQLVDRLTPDGRMPTDAEASRW